VIHHNVHHLAVGVWTRERDKLLGNNPVEVSVLQFLIMFILFHAEGGELQKPVLRGLGDGVQGVQQGQIECAWAGRSVPVRPENSP